MRNTDIARRSVVEVSFDGTDITESIRPYLISLSYNDNEEDECDDIQIRLQDRDGVWITSWLDNIIQATATTSGASLFVTWMYREALLREPEKGGKDFWTAALEQGRKSGTEVAHGIIFSVEKGRKGLDDAQFVNALYRSLLGRQPDNQGKQHWLNRIRNGESRESVFSDFASQPEFQAILDRYGLDEAGVSHDSGFIIEALIIRRNWHGSGKDNILKCGQFQLDDVSGSGRPNEISIKGVALPYGVRIHQAPRCRAFSNVSLRDIAERIGGDSGMQVMFESASNPFYQHKEQIKVSDIVFLQRLCHDAGISLKVTNNFIVLFDQAEYEKKTATLKISRDDGSFDRWKMRIGSAGKRYNSCRVSYTDPETGELFEGTYSLDKKVEDASDESDSEGLDSEAIDRVCGSGDRVLEVTAKVRSNVEAERLARAALRLHNKHSVTLEFDMAGNTGLVSGRTVDVSGFGAWSGYYIIMNSRHTVDGSGGYRTSIKLRPCMG